MKKLLCLLLAAMLLVVCFAGCSNETPNNTTSATTSNTNQTVEFSKPENYASVVLVTINPQFRLYLDALGVVLAVEPVNADAKSIENKVAFENKKVEEVVNNLIVAANDGDFITTDATIDIKITEVTDKAVNATEILNKISTSVNDKLTELEIKATLKTTVELESETPEASSEANNSSEKIESSKPTNTTSTTVVCKHTKTKAVSASTGKNIIDSSKLDAINHNKVCESCKAVVSTEKHTVKNGKCTVCGQSNLAILEKSLVSAGIAGGPSGHVGAEINGDGTPDFDYMLQEGYYAIGFDDLEKKYLNTSKETWMFEIPEAVMLKALKTKFVVDDSLFAKLKAQGKYEFFWCNHTYSNGYFYIPYMAAGDVADYTHNIIGYKDNKNGSFTVYYNYLLGGQDVEAKDRVHQYYYTIEYTYSGASNLTVTKTVDEFDYEYYSINGWKPVVESMRIKSIKKVTNISGITKVQ